MNAPAATTAQHAFFPMGPSTGNLFDVRADVPALVSLEQASCFLACVFQTLQEVAEESSSPDVIYGAAHLTAMAKGVIDAVACGLAQKQRGAA